jgi:hypothetical protein
MRNPQSGNPQASNPHLAALSQRHRSIEGQLEEEMRRPLPDAAVIARLKREKLKVKDAIQREA